MPTTAATSRAESRSASVENPRMSENSTRDLDLLRLDRRLGLRRQPVGQLLRHERRERLARRGLLHHGGVQALELVDEARAAGAVAGHPLEQPGHLRVDGLLRGAEGRRRSPRTPGPSPSCPAAPARAPRRRPVPTGARRSRGSTVLPPAWTSRIARASSSPCAIRSFSRYASPLCPRPSSAIAYSSSSCAESTTTPVSGMAFADRVGAVDPLELERRRHLDVRHDDVGHVLGGGRQERRRVRGHARRPRCRRRSRGARGRPRGPARCPRPGPLGCSCRVPRPLETPVYHPRMIRVVFAEDNYLVREGTAALLADLRRRSSSWATADHLRRAAGRGRGSTRPTPSSPTSGCRPRARTKGIEAAKADPRRATRRSASSCCRSSSRRTTPTTC